MALFGNDKLPRKHPAWAVVAKPVADGHNDGTVIWAHGAIIERDMEEFAAIAGDLFDGDVPKGLTIFEGEDRWTDGSWESPQDGEWNRKGVFRAPTPEEWAAIHENRSPWGSTLADPPAPAPAPVATRSREAKEAELAAEGLKLLMRDGRKVQLALLSGHTFMLTVDLPGMVLKATAVGDDLLGALRDRGEALTIRKDPLGGRLLKLLDPTHGEEPVT